HGDQQDRPAIGLQHAAKLAHRAAVVGNMLQHMAAIDDVERLSGILSRRDVHRNHRPLVRQVGSQIARSQTLAESLAKAGFGSDVQHAFWPAIEEVGAALNIQPEQAMTLKGAAMNAHCLGVGMMFERTEPPRSAAAYRAPAGCSHIRKLTSEATCSAPPSAQRLI